MPDSFYTNLSFLRRNIRNIFYDFQQNGHHFKAIMFWLGCSSLGQKHYTECFFLPCAPVYITLFDRRNAEIFALSGKKRAVWLSGWLVYIRVAHCFVRAKFAKRRGDSRGPFRSKNSLLKYGMMELVVVLCRRALHYFSLAAEKTREALAGEFPLLCEARFLPITSRSKMNSAARDAIVLLR
jgi:hypothetical protein